MKIVRVFPRETNATPKDALSFINCPPPFYVEADEVHISVTFTWDIAQAEWLAEQWKHVAPVKIGGPALGKPSGEFIPGMYLKPGYVITSRGCTNYCWFCSVWKREPKLIELPIKDGWNVLDDNLLACSEDHIKKVFEMLLRQKKAGKRIFFTGGLEAKILKDWHIEMLWNLRPKQMFFAYDTPDDYEPLIEASRRLTNAGFTRHHLFCYVLIGFPNDSIKNATHRLMSVKQFGMCPMAMLWRNNNENIDPVWKIFQREWARPALIYKSKGLL